MAMHDCDHEHHHEGELTEEEIRAQAQAIIEQKTLELVTVGIDIGSSTSAVKDR
jgi:ethanolamine utilization protein EutA